MKGQDVAAKPKNPGAVLDAVPADSSAIAIQQGTPENLLTVAHHFGVTTEDLGELARIGADSINRAMFEITRAGLAFLRAQELLSLGDFGVKKAIDSERSETAGFLEWINEQGLPYQRVYEAMRIAKFVAQLPQDQLDDVLQLGKVKVMLLSSLPQEVIDIAAESGNGLIERADLMTVAELKAEIKDLKKREKNYDAELERKDSLIRRLSNDKKSVTDFLPRTEEIRAECMAQQLGAELALNSLQKLFEEVRADDPDLPEWRMQLEQIWVAAHIAASRALDVLAFMHDHVREGEMPSRVMADHILQPAEAQRWLLDAKLIENRAAAEAAAREEQRDAAKPRGPGRPKGSSTKSGE